MTLLRIALAACLPLCCLAAAGAEPLGLGPWEGVLADDALEHAGEAAWRWDQPAANPRLPVEAPGDWTPYQTLSFWVHVAEPTDSVVTLVAQSENPDSDGMDYYALSFTTDFKGWRRILAPLSTLSRTRDPLGLDHVDGVFLSSNWAHRFDPATVLHVSQLTLDPEPLPGMDRPAGELLPNRSFEFDADADGQPDGWAAGRFDTDAQPALDADVAHAGGRAARIDGAKGARGGYSVGFGPDDTDPDSVYVLSAWIRTVDAPAEGNGTSARITSVGGDGSVLASDYRRAEPTDGAWRRYEWTVALPPGTERFNLVLFHHGEGTAWWDDVSLRRLQRAEALAPRLDACIADARPTFRWRSPLTGPGRLEISTAATFPADGTRTWAVEGDSFTLPEALPAGQVYHWRVITEGQDGGASMTTLPGGEGEDALPRFYAGSWQQRLAGFREQVAPYRDKLERLQAIAERNDMFDPFTPLAETLAAIDALGAAEPDDPAKALAELRERFDELDLYVDWWDTVFLDDAQLYADLNLDYPGLEAVKAAVAAEDWAAARAALHAYYTQRQRPSFYAKYEHPPLRPKEPQRDKRADQYLTHQMPIDHYETPTFDLGPDFNWHILPTVDIEWPTRIHRTYHWEQLAAVYWRTGIEDYAAELRKQLLDFAQDNPMERWDRQRHRWAWSTLNATSRIYGSWIDTWLMIRDSPEWTPDAQFVMLTELREHGRFLMTHFARHGNWVVAEARGLVELGTMFPEFKEAQAWREEGLRRLQHELGEQVLADGMHVERTPGYHAMTLGAFLEPLRLVMHNGMEVPNLETFTNAFEKMHEIYLYGVKPDGRMEHIGDGGMMAVGGQLRRGYEMFGREDMQWVLTNGEEGTPPVYLSKAFEHGGQYFSRSAWNDPDALWSLLDWGGFLGHCHEDMGQISLCAYGDQLLVDTGRYSYDRDMRQPFYQTIGHNTVLVDRTTQKRRDPLEAHWTSTDQFDAFWGLTDNSEPLLHERTVVFRQPGAAGPGYWLVVDRLTGEGSHRLDQRWHTTETMQATADGATITLTPENGDGAALTIANLPQEGLVSAVDEGAVSYEWYEKVPVDVAQFTIEGDMPRAFATLLYPTPPGAAPADITLRRLPAPDGVVALEASIADRGATYRDTWIVNPTGETVTVGDMVTDARIAWRRDEPASWLAAWGRTLTVGGETLLNAPEIVEAAGAVAGTPAVLVADDLQPPRNGQPPRIEVVPPEAPLEPTATAAMLDPGAVPEPVVKMDAVDFSAEGGGAVMATPNKTGADGESFLHWDREGHWLEWRLAVPRAGRWRLLVRACTLEPRALRAVSVNGRVVPGGERVSLSGTGGYSNEADDWRVFALPLELPAGEVTLRLENVDGRSLNVDWVGLAE